MRAPEIIDRLKSGERVQFPAEWLDVFFVDVQKMDEPVRLDVLVEKGTATIGVLPLTKTSTVA